LSTLPELSGQYQSNSSELGTLARSAGPCDSAGFSTDRTTSASVSGTAIARGGLVLAPGTRCVCTHRSASTASGKPMWMNDSSEKKRSFTASLVMKLRTSVPLKIGSQSSHSVVATTVNWARRSHGSM
jgi:hypothetical protein